MKQTCLHLFITTLLFLVGMPATVMAFDQQPVTITYAFNQGTIDPSAAFGSEADAALFKLSYTEYGEGLVLVGKGTVGGKAQNLFQPVAQSGGASDLNAVDFIFAPKHGLTFTPTRVSLQSTRYGTDGGNIDLAWLNSDWSTTTIATGLKPERDNASPAFSTFTQEVTGIAAAANSCGLRLYLYNLGETKQIGLCNIVIEGTVSGTVADAPQYRPILTVVPEEAGSISILPEGTTFEESDRITLQQVRRFGYKFKNWTDKEGNVLSKDDRYTFFISNKQADVVANYVKLNTYELSLSVEGGANDYMVQLQPAPNMTDGKMMYEEGDRVTLTATNNDLFTFTHWSNGESTNTISLGMSQDQHVVAHYAATDFVAAWDFLQPGYKDRPADFANDANQNTMLVLRDADGNTVDWTLGSILDKPAAVNNHSDQPLGTYYFQTKFSTTGYQDIKVSTGMSYNANTYKSQVLEYSLDGTTWTNLATFTFSARSRWRSGTYDLPAAAADKAEVWLRWKADTSADLFGSPTGNADGAALGATIITGTSAYTNDGTAPALLSALPAATNAPINGKVVLTFDKTVTLTANTKATLGSQQLAVTATGNTVLAEYKNLDYNTAYTFTLPAGSISDRGGNKLAQALTVSFTTQARPKVVKKVFDFVVPDDGDLKEAITQAGKRKDKTARYHIFVKDGTYTLPAGPGRTYRHTNGKEGDEEVVKFEGTLPDPITYVNADNVSFIGESREGTVVTNDIPDDAVYPNPPYGVTCIFDGIGNSEVLQLSGTGYYFQDITIKSGMKDALGRNLAIHDKATKTIYKNTCLWGYQDTWTSNNSGPYYFEGGQVRGRTDYMCGKGDAYFNGVELLQLTGGYAAVPSQAAKMGWVYKDCIIRADGADVDGKYTLGRPWGSGTPIALFIDTKMEVLPSAIGWSEMSGGWPKQFAEYNSVDKDGHAVSLSGRKKSFGDGHANNPVLTAEEAAYAADMKNMFGSWDPTACTQQAQAPANLQLTGNTLTWDDNDYVLCWAVCLNGKVVAFTTSPAYAIAEGNVGDYTVRAVNEMGGLGEPTATVTAVRQPRTATANDKGQAYDLKGMRVAPSTKGLLIIDGKKVVK